MSVCVCVCVHVHVVARLMVCLLAFICVLYGTVKESECVCFCVYLRVYQCVCVYTCGGPSQQGSCSVSTEQEVAAIKQEALLALGNEQSGWTRLAPLRVNKTQVSQRRPLSRPLHPTSTSTSTSTTPSTTNNSAHSSSPDAAGQAAGVLGRYRLRTACRLRPPGPQNTEARAAVGGKINGKKISPLALMKNIQIHKL